MGLDQRGLPAVIRVLIVEDEPKVAHALQEGLRQQGYETVIESSGEGAFFRISTERFDVALLDIALPGRDGLEILRALRQRDHETRVLMLTARDTLDDRIRGLESGADDYIVKPYAFSELLARIRAVQRRGRGSDALQHSVGDLHLDRPTRRVTRAGQPVELTVREFDLLEYLMRFSGEVVSREALARDVWGERSRSSTLDNVIDVHVARLRRKIEGDGGGKLIHTARGIGFVIGANLP
jgi:two-component system, OmpR family, copper resistance phosphate regulon response regulator CusR